jgi:hypothetical protein
MQPQTCSNSFLREADSFLAATFEVANERDAETNAVRATVGRDTERTAARAAREARRASMVGECDRMMI